MSQEKNDVSTVGYANYTFDINGAVIRTPCTKEGYEAELLRIQNEGKAYQASILSQAAQFDGPMNNVIERAASDAWCLNYTYEQYVILAHNRGTTAVSMPEYNAMCKAKVHDMVAFAPKVDKNDKILVEHWDSNILFQQRNHTE